MKRRVVVTGLGAVTPLGNDAESFWEGIKAGKVGIQNITRFDTTDYKIRIDARTLNSKECMFFITRLNKLKTEKIHAKPYKTVKSRKLNCSIYKFDSFDDICNFFNYVSGLNIQNIEEYAEECKIFKYQDFYYLAFNKINHNYSNVAIFNSTIVEFSKFYASKRVFISALEEKGEKILDKDTIKTCKKYYIYG